MENRLILLFVDRIYHGDLPLCQENASATGYGLQTFNNKAKMCSSSFWCSLLLKKKYVKGYMRRKRHLVLYLLLFLSVTLPSNFYIQESNNGNLNKL